MLHAISHILPTLQSVSMKWFKVIQITKQDQIQSHKSQQNLLLINKHVHTHIHQQENNHIQKKFSFLFFFYFLILMIRKFELKKKERINKKNESKVHGIHFITTRTTANQSGVRPSDARQTKTLQQEK